MPGPGGNIALGPHFSRDKFLEVQWRENKHRVRGESTESSRSSVETFLALIERAGNALPHPATLFAALAVVLILLSWVFSRLDLQVVHPATGETVVPVNLLSVEGVHRILTEMVANFTGFAPLGTVLVAMLGIGVAEGTGLISAALRLLVTSVPRRLLTFVVVVSGVLSNTASEIGYVLLVPLGAVIFRAAGRHPLAGLAAAFAGVSGGYSANLLLGTVDPLLAGLTTEAARIVDPAYNVNPACNYYFLAVSTLLVAAAGTWVTEWVVVPRLGVYQGGLEAEGIKALSGAGKRGLAAATLTAVVSLGLVLLGLVPKDGYLREAETGSVLHSPFLQGIVAFIFLIGTVAGIVYGAVAGTIRNDSDVVNTMGKAMEALGVYMVLVFFAAQFVAFFRWTNLGLIMAVEGALFLKTLGLGAIPLMLAFILLTAVTNLVMGSASAKWAIMAPVFVPMLMLLGYSPELVQAAYRVGDSVTNIVSPMMSYFALIVAFVQKYEPQAGIGTVVATMLPYSLVFLGSWTLQFCLWVFLGLPVGPGTPLFL